MSRFRWVAVGLCVVVCAPTDALAWGNEGHRIICQIAFERLTMEGRALLDAIQADLKDVEDPFDNCPACQADHDDDGRPMSFQAGCIWADESRRDTFKGTYEYHYVNLPTGSTAFDLDRDCAALDCAVVAIQRYARYIALPRSTTSSRERERRVLALRFLGHFVGDLHQPLHVGFAEDLGAVTAGMYYIVQPYAFGTDRARQATIVSTHETVEDAYGELDRIAARLNRNGLASDVIELLVVDENRHVVSRSSTH